MNTQLISQGTYVKVGDDMTFPSPGSERLSDIEWRFRHARESVTTEDLLTAASVMSAYKELVLNKAQRDRNAVCSAIQSVAKQ